jgi:rhodanese-related sulfurtransferase
LPPEPAGRRTRAEGRARVRRGGFAIGLLGLLGACAAPKHVPVVSSLDAAAREFLIVDIRPAAERAEEGHPPESFHRPYWAVFGHDQAFGDDVRRAAQGRPVAVLCRAGVSSRYAASTLRASGLTAYSIEDGFAGNERGPGWLGWALPVKRNRE